MTLEITITLCNCFHIPKYLFLMFIDFLKISFFLLYIFQDGIFIFFPHKHPKACLKEKKFKIRAHIFASCFRNYAYCFHFHYHLNAFAFTNLATKPSFFSGTMITFHQKLRVLSHVILDHHPYICETGMRSTLKFNLYFFSCSSLQINVSGHCI